MRAYEIFLNGKRLCVAGVGSDGYVSAYATYQLEPNTTWIDAGRVAHNPENKTAAATAGRNYIARSSSISRQLEY